MALLGEDRSGVLVGSWGVHVLCSVEASFLLLEVLAAMTRLRGAFRSTQAVLIEQQALALRMKDWRVHFQLWRENSSVLLER